MSKSKIKDPGLHIAIFLVLLISVISLTVGFSITHLKAHQNNNEPKIVESCQSLGKSYFVYFKDNLVIPDRVDAKTCDVITFINQDKFRLIAFGQHNSHTSYNGIYEQPLKPGDSFNITLDKTGQYHFHDHYQDYITGSFSVL